MNISTFLDSGAHSLYELTIKKAGKGYEYIETDEFWKFVDDYAQFIKEHKNEIDIYVNMDIIFRPDLTWRVQKYLEDTHKLSPLPVFHAGEDLKWLKKYIDNYDYVGIGGLGQDVTKGQWIKNVGDPAFSLICDTKDSTPRVKAHGFAMTAPDIMFNYPWYSVDSTSWVMYGKYGIVLIPKTRNGKRNYSLTPWTITVSTRSPSMKLDGEHFRTLPLMQQKLMEQYFAEKGFKIGKSEFRKVETGYKLGEGESFVDKKKKEIEIVAERGLCNDHSLRDQINLLYFLDMQNSIPPWPWPWRKKTRARRLSEL